MPTDTRHGDTAPRDAPTGPHSVDPAALDARLQAVERAVHGADPGAATPADHTADVADRIANVERRLDDLDAAIQSLQGYVGSVESVNESVERRANAALAAAERPQSVHPVPDLPDPTPEPAQTADSDDASWLARLLRR
ncbi:DUF7310 family coiled-coil domain-containing protein [Halarchaeum sp. P4]|uniref:DUF7310 family coiled-coil domain-containing protein n=1 Tax=Halarchaeum sp. P4 TaxID=3421639 RepID=UPI003EC0F3A4